MRVHIRYLISKPNRRDGTCRYYWQPSKKLATAGFATVPLPPDESLAIDKAKALNAELDAWYVAGRPRRVTSQIDAAPDGSRPRGTVWHLIELYRNPPSTKLAEDPEKREGERGVFTFDYNGLEKKTKRSYDGALDWIAKWLGPLPVRKITEAIVLEHLRLLSEQRHTKGPFKGHRKVATALLVGRVGRLLFNASRTLVDRSHPCYVSKSENPWGDLRARQQRIATPVLWTKEGRDLIIAAAEKMEWKSVAAAIRINWWLGQREGDILSLGHNFNPVEVLRLVQSKTTGSVHLPVGMVPEIGETIEALRRDQNLRKLSAIKLLINERNGLIWKEDAFRKAFSEVRTCAIEEARCAGRSTEWIDAHIAPLTFMRLRHTVVTMLYRAGATVPEIAAITGHTITSVNQIIERYGVRDEITAGNAIQKRLDREGA